MKIINFTVSAIVLTHSLNCLADDSIALVAVGGIEFKRTNDIRMTYEQLNISQDTIEINFKFLNTSNRDIQTTVAFPKPRYSYNPGFSESMANNKPLGSFSTEVDGQDAKVTIDRRALSGNKDITNQLRNIGLTDKQIFETFAMCTEADGEVSFCGITKKQEAELKNIESWEVAETAYWEQVFPARKEISVSHKYSPLTGRYYFYGNNSKDEIDLKRSDDVCVDEATTNAMKNKIRSHISKGAKYVMVDVAEVEYVLWTGRNWGGTIDIFKLHLIKRSPDQVVSLCFSGKAKRLNETTIEFSQKDYIPPDKLRVNFYSFYDQH